MTKFVLDSSVAMKTVLPEADSDKAIALLNNYQNQIHELISPDILPAEVAHALLKAERRGLLKLGEANHKLFHVLANRPTLFPYLPLLPRAAAIASQARIGFYDCLYVALAEQENCDLVTSDVKLIKALPGYPIRDLATI